MTYNGPLPDVTDPLTAPFWQAARAHRLEVQRCRRGLALRWQPAAICPECLTPGGDWTPLSGHGEIYSFAVYHRAMHPDFTDLVPYTVALVTLDEGVEMHGLLRTTGAVKIGERVCVDFVDIDDAVSLVMWKPTTAAPTGELN
jgi:uncharacterized OB-fold protein